MTIESLNGKRVCILGFGREGQATLRAIHTHCKDVSISIHDGNEKLQATSYKLQKDSLDLAPCTLNLGSNYLENLDQYDIIIKSPGIKPCPELEAVKYKITNATQIFLDTVQSKGCRVIGITGSKGKSTTSSLIYAVLKEAGMNVDLVGNIGIPALDHLDDIMQISDTRSSKLEAKTYIMELSSYQLMDCTVSPDVAVITSFFPDHLDYHGSLEAYVDAKKHCTKFQTSSDFVFFDASSDGAREIAMQSPGTKIECTENDSLVAIKETHLLGHHNLRNIALVCKVAEHLQIDPKKIKKAIQEFVSLPHRLQSLGVHHGIEWIDDAISTTPESTIAGLNALEGKVKILICGGQDRGYNFIEFGEFIVNSAIEHVILFPESGERIEDAIIHNSKFIIQNCTIHHAKSMKEAVEIAKKTESRISNLESRICLLSPASPSYNMYKNFEEKGQKFKEEIM